jgi:hypothetical protein
MSKKAWITFFLLLCAIQLGSLFIGEWVALASIVVMALGGIVLTVHDERLKRRISRFLGALEESDQDALLVWDEGWDARPEIVARLGRRGPPVPLRGAQEEFTYASHHATMARVGLLSGVMVACMLSALAIFEMPVDRWERILLFVMIAVMTGIALSMPWQIRIATSRVVITDDTVTVVDRRGRGVSIPWAHIVDAKDSAINHMLRLRTVDGRRIWVGHFIDRYGRLANLIESRLPEHVAWRAS